MFGLCCIHSLEKFSLKSVTVKCNVRNLLVECTSEIVYKNETLENSEALFSFPLEGSCVVYHFEAVIDGKTIVGICKELEEAKNMYKVAVEAGQKAALIERNRSMTDVFKCRIGNMPKNSEAKIIVKFAMELKLSLSKSEDTEIDRFNLSLPLILRPRYTPADYVGDTDVYHVSNMYEYNFQAEVTGTKEIRKIFSNNYQLNVTTDDSAKLHSEVTLESKFNGKHDLDIYIDYAKMRIPSILYEYGTASTKFNGKKTTGAFYKTDVAMLNFLPQFEKNIENLQKMEIVFVVDRSGSMHGSNIQNAQECLLIFLKSLPTNCKFQIYGFGSTFDKLFPHPQLYDDQSMSVAMNYQRNLNADLGGTELMNPLKDLYGSSLTNDYTRVVFLLTDGDVGNQDEVFQLVRNHNQSTRLFTVGIGDGVSTSLVQKVAESGNGKSAFVRDSKTLSASVIELLDIALNCDQFTDCSIKWTCPKNTSVVMVPSNPPPVFSNYFLTVFCMIKGLCEGESIQCHLSGNVNGKPMSLNLDVNGKDGFSDDEFRVHRLLAKYKIDEMTPKIEDGNEELKKSLIELSLEVNMVTNFTTFVAIDKDVSNKILAVDEYSAPVAQACNFMAMRRQCIPMSKKLKCANRPPPTGSAMMDCAPCPPGMMKLSKADCSFGSGNISLGMANIVDCSIPPPPPPVYMEIKERPCTVSEIILDIVLFLADKQNISGSWNINDEVLKKLQIDILKMKNNKPGEVNEEVWMTVIVYQYLVVKQVSRENEWRLFAKKAKQWLTGKFKDASVMEKIMQQGHAML